MKPNGTELDCDFFFRYLSDTYSVLQRLGVPGPKPVWVFGNVMEFKNKVMQSHMVTSVIWVYTILCLFRISM